MKRVVSIQDISGLGRCSLTVALPVISAIGVECAIVPTAVLSTHTVFQGFTKKDLSDQIRPIADHWQKEGFHFDAIYTGYLATEEQIEAVCDFIHRFRKENTLIFVDPAMADNGRLYPTFDSDFPSQMARLCAAADVIVPNITEACLLTGTPYLQAYTQEDIRLLLKKLCSLGAKKAVLTGVGFQPDALGIMAYDPAEDRFFSYFSHHFSICCHGTGDLFAATCVGAMMEGHSFEDSLRIAVDFTVESIRLTAEAGLTNHYGVEFERAIPYLLRRLGKI